MPPKNTMNSPAPPAPWAARSGEDTFGAFADLELKGQAQRFRWCPPGTFVTGGLRYKGDVTLARGFWMADTPVTQGLYAAVMGRNPSQFRSAFSVDLPVERVSWHDAQEFVKSLNKLTRSNEDSFRLPTEAEWEYTARAGTTGKRYGPVEAVAWTEENSFGRPHSVGQKGPNPWGLYDALGNVWEWVQDRHGVYPPGNLFDPKGLGHTLGQVFRGGSWLNTQHLARAVSRGNDNPRHRDSDIGFRLAR